MHHLPKWSIVSFCICVFINLKPGLLVLSWELRTVSQVSRMVQRKETAWAVNSRTSELSLAATLLITGSLGNLFNPS